MYTVNDLLDAPIDRQHPKKKHRPIASRELSVAAALAILVVCLLVGLVLAWIVSWAVLAGVGTYVLLQIAYNTWLKTVPIADVFTIALGFVLRAALGAVAISVVVSGWLLFVTAALAILVGFAKRRSEFVSQGESAVLSRPVLGDYTLTTLNALVIVSAAASILSYGIYSIESSTARLYPGIALSSLFVAYGVLRYLLLTLARDEGGEPETLIFADRQILGALILTVVSIVAATQGMQIPFIGDANVAPNSAPQSLIR
jgi:4-hydroxybenzoate polyprenyltransferase